MRGERIAQLAQGFVDRIRSRLLADACSLVLTNGHLYLWEKVGY